MHPVVCPCMLWAGGCTAQDHRLRSISSPFWASSCGGGGASSPLVCGPGLGKRGRHGWICPYSCPQGATRAWPVMGLFPPHTPAVHGAQGPAALGRADQITPQPAGNPLGRIDFNPTGPICPTPQRCGVFPHMILIKLHFESPEKKILFLLVQSRHPVSERPRASPRPGSGR